MKQADVYLITHKLREARPSLIAWDFYLTEIQAGKACGILVCHWQGAFVTCWYRQDDTSWSFGHYFDEPTPAIEDGAARAAEKGVVVI